MQDIDCEVSAIGMMLILFHSSSQSSWRAVPNVIAVLFIRGFGCYAIRKKGDRIMSGLPMSAGSAKRPLITC